MSAGERGSKAPALAEGQAAQLLKLGRAVHQDMVAIRRDLHAHPEPGMEEFRTAGEAARFLKGLGIEAREGVGRTGVVGSLRGGLEQASEDTTGGAGRRRVIALRADMDALPIEEKNEVEYRSRRAGLMHACGHDGHVATLLGAAAILRQVRSSFGGEVRLIFQPAEEGPGGALPMIAQGALQDPPVDAIVGFHLWPELPVGSVGVRDGPLMAAVDEVDITVRGKGGHAAAPHQTVDAVVVAAHVIAAAQTIVSRAANPVEPVVLSIGTINGGYRYNVIADSVSMRGTIRSASSEVQAWARQRLDAVLRGVTGAFGASYELGCKDLYPPTVNDARMTGLVERVCWSILGRSRTVRQAQMSMGGEDFAYYLEKVPGTYVLVGCSSPSVAHCGPAHSSTFDFDEGAMVYGAAVLAGAALAFLTAVV